MVVRPWCGLFTYCCNSPIKYYDPDGAKEECCCEGIALSVDVYILEGANSNLLSQVLSAAFIDTDLPSLGEDLQKAITGAITDIGQDESVSQLLPDTTGGLAVGYLTNVISNVIGALAARKPKVCNRIANRYVTARSDNMDTYSHTAMIFYYGHYETRFQMMHYDTNGNVLPDKYNIDISANHIFDLSAVRAIHAIVSKIFKPVYHNHPKGFTTFDKYRNIIKEYINK